MWPCPVKQSVMIGCSIIGTVQNGETEQWLLSTRNVAGAIAKSSFYVHLVLINLNLNNHMCVSRDLLMDSEDLAPGMQ